MSAIAFDTLQFSRRLKAAGVPENQAETQAELMAEALFHNMEGLPRFIGYNLVTKDYLDARLDARFSAQDVRIDTKFAKINQQLSVHNWILAAIAASTVVPALHSLFNA